MECLITGNSILFRGFSDERARERVKSITVKQGKLCWIWCEEVCEIQRSDLNILDDRLRGELPNSNLYYQITMSTNPVSVYSWVKTDFWDWDSPEVFKCHSTWRDNRFIGPEYAKRMERRKEVDPEGWRIYSEGEWGQAEGLILHNYTIEDLSHNYEDYDSYHYAQDFGWNHHNVILEVAFKDSEIYVLRELYVSEMDTEQIIKLAESYKFNKSKIMYSDSAEPDRINMWKRAGYHAVPVKKEPNSVKAQIDYLKQHKIHIDGSCLGTIKEISQWSWKRDKTTGLYLDEPVDFEDDAMAALRYCIEPYRRNNKLRTLDKNLFGL